MTHQDGGAGVRVPSTHPRPSILALAENGFLSTIMLNDLVAAEEITMAGIVLSSVPMNGRGFGSSFRRVLSHSGWNYLSAKVLQYLCFRAGLSLQRLRRDGRRLRSIAELARFHGLPLHRTADVNSSRTRSFIEENGPDVLASLGFNQVLTRETLSLARVSCINLHPGPLPRYRGLNPYFWVLRFGETSSAMTAHLMDEGIDTGRILASRKIPIEPEDSASCLQIRTAETGADLLVEAIRRLDRGEDCRPGESGAARYFSLPSKREVASFRQRGRKLVRLRTACRFFRSYAARP